MCAVLAVRGFHPIPAQNVDMALRLLGTERVDAIVLDLRLPDPTGLHRSGLDLLRFVRATIEHAQIPVIVFTGAPLSTSEEEIVRNNRARVFFKPQPYAVLCDHLSMMLEGAAPQ